MNTEPQAHHPEDTAPKHDITNELIDIRDSQEAQVETRHITSVQEAEDYLNFIRTMYRDGKGEYRGNPSEDQELERMIMEDEARELLDGLRKFVESMSGQEPKETSDRDEYHLGSLELEDMIGAFIQLYKGMTTLTHRLAAKDPDFKASGYQSLFDLPPEERALVATQLFYDFQTFNARRFGAEGVGLESRLSRRNDFGEREVTTFDRDKVRGASTADIDKTIASVASRTEYRQGIVMHPAGKISPDDAAQLRREHPTLSRDDFYKELWNHRDAFEKIGQNA